MSSRNLHPLLSDIADKLIGVQNRIQELTGEVKKVQETLQEGFDKLYDAIYDNIQAQAELKMMEYVADVQIVRPQIQAECQQIEREKDELDDRLEGIKDRYARKHDELDQRAEQRIRDLGEHIFRIEETEFEHGVEDVLLGQLTTTWEELRDHNRTVKDERSRKLRSSYDETVETIDTFVEERSSLLERIDHHRTDAGPSISEPRTLQVPYWIVTVERDGVTEQQVVGPSGLRYSDGDERWCSAWLETYGGIAEPVERLAETRVPTEPNRQVNVETLIDRIEQYGRTDLFGLVSYDDEFGRALPQQLAIEVETGERHG